jgi:O-antigen/teichoic acid export membrane protein
MTHLRKRQWSPRKRLGKFLAAPAFTKIGTMIGTNLLVPLMALAVAPLLARELGVEGRGIYTALTAPVLLAGIIGTFGLQDGLSQFISRRGLSPRRALKTAAVAVLALSAFTAGIMAILGLFLFEDHGQRLEYTFVLTTIPLLIGHNLMIGIATGSRDIRGLNGTKLIPAAVRAMAVVLLCVFTDMTPFTAALLLLVAPVLGIIWQTWRILAARQPASPTDAGAAVSPGSNGQLFKFSLAAFPGVLAAMLMTRADQVIGLPLLGAEQLGHYAIAVTVAELPMMVATAGRSYILGHERTKDTRGVPRLAWALLAANGAICLVLMAVVPWGIPWIFGDAFKGSVIPCIILLFGTVCYTAMSLGSAILLSEGRPHSQSIAYTASACVGIAMLYVLSNLGAVGAALASVLGYAVAATISWVLIRNPRNFRTPRPRRKDESDKLESTSNVPQDISSIK